MRKEDVSGTEVVDAKEEGRREEVNTKTEGRTKREGLKVLTAPDDVEVVIKHVCENSEGTLKENDFDDRLKSFWVCFRGTAK